MNKIVASFFLMGLAAPVATPAVAQAAAANGSQPMTVVATQASKRDMAHAIINIMFPPAQRAATMDKLLSDILTPIRQNMPMGGLTDPGLKALLNTFMDKVQAQQQQQIHRHFPELVEAMATAYENAFSEAELLDVLAFASSPSGQRYLSRSITLASDPAVTKVYSAMIAEGNALNKPLLDEFKTEAMAYLKAHPEVAKKMATEAQAK